MLDFVRTGLHRAITSPFGDSLLPVRLPKDLARRMNMLAGEPICSSGELARRRAGLAKLEELKKNGGKPVGGSAPVVQAQAPVTLYFEKDRNARLFGRMIELLDAKNVKYTMIDVTGDQSALDFAMREAKVKADDLPVVFVGPVAVGGYNELVDWDVSGRLAKALAGN